MTLTLTKLNYFSVIMLLIFILFLMFVFFIRDTVILDNVIYIYTLSKNHSFIMFLSFFLIWNKRPSLQPEKFYKRARGLFKALRYANSNTNEELKEFFTIWSWLSCDKILWNFQRQSTYKKYYKCLVSNFFRIQWWYPSPHLLLCLMKYASTPSGLTESERSSCNWFFICCKDERRSCFVSAKLGGKIKHYLVYLDNKYFLCILLHVGAIFSYDSSWNGQGTCKEKGIFGGNFIITWSRSGIFVSTPFSKCCREI